MVINIKKIDVRKIFVDAQEQLMCDVINLRKNGITYTCISHLLKISVNSICKFCKNYSLNGEQWLKDKKRGIKTRRKAGGINKGKYKKLRKIY